MRFKLSSGLGCPAQLHAGCWVPATARVSQCLSRTCPRGTSARLLHVKQGHRQLLAAEQQLTGDQQAYDAGAHHHDINVRL